MRIVEDVKLDFDDILLQPKFSEIESRKDVCVGRTFKTRWSAREIMNVPIMPSNMTCTGTVEMANEFDRVGAMGCLHKYITKEVVDNMNSTVFRNTFLSVGLEKGDIKTYPIMAHNLCIDAANGYTKKFLDTVKAWRERLPRAVIMAGNVVTGEGVERLLMAGADIVKIGIGPGSVCTTRLVTGCGYPQLSAILECKDAAHGLNGLICSDGGCRTPGDVCKAFAAGADFVMLGGMLAGTDECDGEWAYKTKVLQPGTKEYDDWYLDNAWNTKSQGVITRDQQKKSLRFYGMASEEAMKQNHGGVAEYRAAEGKCVEVPYKGPVKDVLQEILGGIRSCCAYIGAKRIKDMNKCATMVKVRRTHNRVFE